MKPGDLIVIKEAQFFWPGPVLKPLNCGRFRGGEFGLVLPFKNGDLDEEELDLRDRNSVTKVLISKSTRGSNLICFVNTIGIHCLREMA